MEAACQGKTYRLKSEVDRQKAEEERIRKIATLNISICSLFLASLYWCHWGNVRLHVFALHSLVVTWV